MYRNNWIPEVFNDFIYNANMPRTNATAPAVNVKEAKDKYILELAAAGMRKDDFDVSLNGDGDLKIKMENKTQQKDDEVRYLRREFAYGTYEQTIILPDDVDRDKIRARVQDGILTVELPKMTMEERMTSRQISVA